MLESLALLMAVTPVPAMTQAAPAAAQTLYIVIYTPGPAWIAGKAMHEQKLAGHVTFIRGLLADGRLVAGGPFTDRNGGMAILRAASIDDARAIVATDSAIKDGVFLADIRPWQPRFDSGKPLAP